MSVGQPSLSLVFPGQGSQAVGMGGELAAAFPVAKAVFDEVDAALGENLFALMQDGPESDLTLTRNAQPALMAVSLAAFRVLQDEAGLTLDAVRSVAGHSLGEYSAYCAAGAFSLADAATLLRLRGDAMQEAVPVGEGGMAAILGLTLDQIAEVLAGTGAELANDNAPGQVVVSGPVRDIDTVCARAKTAGAKRALPLTVSAPFHSSLMGPAQERMAEALAATTIAAPAVPIFSNVTVAKTSDPQTIRETLTAQVTGRVRWTETISAMVEDGTTLFAEVGSGKVLSGLIRRIAKGTATVTVGTPSDIDSYRDAVAH